MTVPEIVNVQITRETQTVSQAGFGTPLIMGIHKAFNERVKYYANMTEVGADFSSDDLIYIASQDVFAQSPRPVRLGVGRRASDITNLEVETALSGFDYTVTINGTALTIDSTSIYQESTVVLDDDLVSGNYEGVTINSSVVETVNSVVTFDADFVSLNSILPTVNGVGLTPVPFNGTQGQTLTDVATAIQGDAGVTTATVTDAPNREITVVFALIGANVLDSVITTLGVSQPVATIFSSQFLFDTDHDITMGNIATAIALETNIASATVGDANNRTIAVLSNPNTNGIMNAFTINGGATQAGEVITTSPQAVTKVTIAGLLEDEINSVSNPWAVTADQPLTPDGTLTLEPDVAGVAYTVSVSTNIILPNEARVSVTQAKPLTQYTVEINGVPISYTTTVEIQDNETIATALVSLINLSSGISVVATDNLDGSFELDNLSPFSLFVTEQIMSKEFGLIIDPFVATDTISNDLDAIETENNDWYALAYTRRVQSEVEAIASWIETRSKIFGTASSDANIIDVVVGTDVTSISAVLNQAGYTRSFVMYHQDVDSDFPECAWFGKTLPTIPGSITWKFKTLASIPYSKLTTSQSTNARNKKTNTFEFIGGAGITREGTVASGEFIDVIRGVDWLTARIQEYVYSLLVNSPKVPYTSSGITSVEAEIRRALDQGVANDFIAETPQYTVTVPTIASISPTDKANRILKDVTFQATLAGSVHFVEIQGVVSV